MSEKPFVHLHLHTAYSLLDGACPIERAREEEGGVRKTYSPLMDRVQELGMPAVAITDHGVLYGAVEFYQRAKAQAIKPIIGCEMYIAKGSMHDRKVEGRRTYSNHFGLLAENEEGYANLVRLVSLAHLEGFYYKPRIDKELLAQHHRGLIGLTGCLQGEVASHILQGDLDGAVRAAGEFADLLGPGNVFLELEDHGLPEQKTANRGLREVAQRTGLPLIASNDVHYLKKEHWAAHDVMLCLQTQTTFSDPKRMRYSSHEFYLKSPEEMWEIFGREVPDALRRTVEIAERCNVTMALDEELHFPVFKLPPGQTHKQYLIALAREGLRKRYGVEDPGHPKQGEEKICQRFFFELDVIEKTRFINYFLVVSDFVRFARESHIPVGPGRGSGAGSLIAYCLGITGIEPLRYNLFFERFLNPDRVSPPDFDIDFCQARRGEVIEYVKQKYGQDSVAQIITFNTMGAKSVIRDVGRALEIPYPECDKLAKMVPEEIDITLERALEVNPEFRRAAQTDPAAKRIMQFAPVIEGLPRNAGTHAAGVVIAERPLIELVPLQRDKEEQIITQFEMKPIGQLGLLKMDFLGLKTLTVIQEAVDNVRAARGVELDMDTLPMDDARTFELLTRGDTVGVFQVESRGMRDLLRRIGLTCFEDLIAMIALFRPGPMRMLEDYINRKHGKVKIVYEHPSVEPILKETYGIMLYQEQVMQCTQVLAGFTLGQGDTLRWAIGKKKKDLMASLRERFVEGCIKTSRIPRAKAEKIFLNIEQFAGYGFNKSHSAAYAILSYQTAYLKARYPAEFIAALLSSEMGNTDKLPILIGEAQEMGLKVLPPNVNESGVRFQPKGDAILFGMAGVKNVGAAAVEAIVKEREAGGPFKGLVDFCSRMNSQLVNKRVIESLVKCGAFDFTHIPRGRLFPGVEFAMSRAAAAQRDRRAGQRSLFEMLGEEARVAGDDQLPAGEPWPTNEMLAHEKELIGFYISGHPLKEHEWSLRQFSLVPSGELGTAPQGAPVRIGGLIAQYRQLVTKKSQELMAVFRLEGLNDAAEVVVFPSAFKEYGPLLRDEAAVMVCGELDRQEQVKVKAAEIYALGDVHSYFAQKVFLHLPAANLEQEKLAEVKGILQKHPGKTPVVFCLQFPTGEKVFCDTGLDCRVGATEALVHDITHALGEDSIYIDVFPQACRRPPNGRNGWNGRRQG
ncbi:MAG: DNA polymerase III subunit alpha [Kiritimatiellae bacterium]|nr:DNA polymerase III subunit alpha [Kiritimatiellia bacterium]